MLRHRDSSQPERVIGWRVQRLVRAGVDRSCAERIARDQGYDLHELLDLIDRGASVTLALRILAPLAREPAR